MKRHRILKAFQIAALALVACAVFGYVVQRLWNWLVPAVFGFHTITFVQALGLLVLSKILFGGFHRHSGGRGRRWKQHLQARWESMTPAEREQFQSGLRGRRGCGPRRTPAPESTQV